MSEEEVKRNQASFIFFAYHFDSNREPVPLRSTLTNLKGLTEDFTKLTINAEYEKVGETSFVPKILRNVRTPCPGYPTFKTLGVIELKYEGVYVRKQMFQKCLVVIPQCFEETQPEELEKYLLKLTKQTRKDVFVGFPF